MDLKPIKENELKWENLENEAKKQFPNVLFSLRFLYIPFIFGLLLIIRFKEEKFLNNWVMFLFIIFAIFYFFYLRKIRNAIAMVELPPSMEPRTPQYLKLWWHFTFTIWTTTQELIFGRSKLTVDELQYMVLKNRNRYWRIGMFTAFCGSIITTKMWLYSGSIYTSPSTRLKNLLLSGYYSPLNSTLKMAWALETRGCKMESFCYPGTNVLDPSAIQRANDYISFNRDSGEIIGIEVPLPVGPHGQITDSSNISIEKETSVLK